MRRHVGVKRSELRLLFAAMVCVLCGGALAGGQQADWYPSRWGADDRRGAANYLSAAKVIEAKNLITRGEVYELGRVYEAGMPQPPIVDRHYSLRLPYAIGPLGTNNLIGHESIISGELGQVGTQFDGLGHVSIGTRFYNGVSQDGVVAPDGLRTFGVEQIGPIVTRGVLIDVAAYKGVDMLDGGYEITPDDLRGALSRQGVTITTGDVVLIHTGWGLLWMKDNERFSGSEPGIGLEAARFLIDQEIVMVGSDNLSTEVLPNPDPSLALPIHQELMTKNGTYNMENLATEVLAAEQVYEFAFFYVPLPLKGSPGSPGNPLAIR